LDGVVVTAISEQQGSHLTGDARPKIGQPASGREPMTRQELREAMKSAITKVDARVDLDEEPEYDWHLAGVPA